MLCSQTSRVDQIKASPASFAEAVNQLTVSIHHAFYCFVLRRHACVVRCVRASMCVYTHIHDHFTNMSREQNVLLGKCTVLRPKRLGEISNFTYVLGWPKSSFYPNFLKPHLYFTNTTFLNPVAGRFLPELNFFTIFNVPSALSA